ncbi:PTS sugar transporter subunit IIA [Arthrobacter sp. HY1533]|uniref:PTS sugar transporter subunit IIA n=1 Tax=Arthrobacter sp. HY1533 TaxID=2970919 RepID=UPI0022BA0A3F|nr:PTS glucose transporter subunit IIA [Arthrobacter sp. HY1533]
MIIYSPLEGERVDLGDVDDPAFSKKMLGDGVAIRPTGNLVSAPFSGGVVSLFPTKHAIGLVSDAGVEALIHIGLDTVAMNGDGFEAHILQGQRVTAGQPLVTFNTEKIIAAGCDPITLIVITNMRDVSEIVQLGATELATGDRLLEVTLSDDASSRQVES